MSVSISGKCIKYLIHKCVSDLYFINKDSLAIVMYFSLIGNILEIKVFKNIKMFISRYTCPFKT